MAIISDFIENLNRKIRQRFSTRVKKISSNSQAEMTKPFYISNGLKPTSLKDVKCSLKKKESVRSIISDYVKDSRKRALEYESDDDDLDLETKQPLESGQRLKNLSYLDGSTDEALKGIGDHGFFTAIFECYNNHWGLRTVPDDWWHTIIHSVALSIDANSMDKAVRDHFIKEEGRKRLTVDVNPNGIDYKSFFRDMTELLQSNIRMDNYVSTIRSDFTTSTLTHQIASEITAMSSVKEYFEFCLRTRCGLPFVELEGTEEDWIRLKSKVIDLKNILAPIHQSIGLKKDWWKKIEKICDKLIDTYRGDGDQVWWSNILSYNEPGRNSGDDANYDGWFIRDLLKLSGKVFEELTSIPSGIVSVPLIFNDNGVETDWTIASGIAGIRIDDSTEVPVVSSVHGWTIFQSDVRANSKKNSTLS